MWTPIHTVVFVCLFCFVLFDIFDFWFLPLMFTNYNDPKILDFENYKGVGPTSIHMYSIENDNNDIDIAVVKIFFLARVPET